MEHLIYKIVLASEICVSVFDGTHDSPKYQVVGFPLITSKHLGSEIKISEAQLISKYDFEKINERSKVMKHDVLISMIGTVGNISIIKDIPNFAIKNIGVLRAKNQLDAKLIYYYMQSQRAQSEIKSSLVGSTQPFLSLSKLRNFPIYYPVNNKFKQHIVNTIGSVDDLIEKNQEFLDKFQVLLSKYYDSFSLKCSNEVKLGSLIIRTGKTLKNDEWMESKLLDLSTMPNGSIFVNNFSDGSAFSTNIKTVNNFDLVYGSIRPYFKKAGFALDVNYIAGSVYSFKPENEKYMLWLLACISSDSFHSFTSSSSQGTKMPIINWDTFTSFKLKLDDSTIDDFNKKLLPVFEMCVNKMRENRKLKLIKQQLLDKYF